MGMGAKGAFRSWLRPVGDNQSLQQFTGKIGQTAKLTCLAWSRGAAMRSAQSVDVGLVNRLVVIIDGERKSRAMAGAIRALYKQAPLNINLWLRVQSLWAYS